jgi:hypothetical protein
MPKKLTKEIVNERIKERNIELIGPYYGDGTKTIFRGKCDHEWEATPRNIMNGRNCPKCSDTRLTKEMVNERIKDRDIELISEYKTLTKSLFRCKCSHEWEAFPNNIIAGSGCPNNTHIYNKLSKEEINKRLSPSGIEIVGEYIRNSTKSIFRCRNDHEWETHPASIMKKPVCPYCIGYYLTKEIVNERIKDRGIELVGEYIDSKTRTLFRGQCKHEWYAASSCVMRGTGCPICNPGGYNQGKSGYIYILDFGHFIKYGITNNLKKRLASHKKNGIYTVILTKLYEDGRIAQNWERDIKIIFGGRFVTQEIMPDGYTETLSRDKLEALLDTIK